jgi:putative transposase
MARGKPHTPERIIGLPREVAVAQGRTVAEFCREQGISEQTHYRWRTEFGGLKLDQARRLKELERENQRLHKAVADLTLDKLIVQEAARGPVSATASA